MTNINWHEISIFDYSIAGILTIFLLRGLCVGFVRQLGAAAALVGSYWLAGAYALQIPPLAAQHLPQLEDLAVRPAVLFWSSFGGFYLLFLLLFSLIGKLLAVKLLGWTDRLAGGLLGLARGAFVAALLFMPLTAVLPAQHPLFEGSLTAPQLAQGAELIRQFIRDLKIREDIRPMPPEDEKQPEPLEERTPPPPADGTLVAPDAIPDTPSASEPERSPKPEAQAAPVEN
ncbi:MAG: CvpA family protein [Candidatus Electronema sp. VV]